MKAAQINNYGNAEVVTLREIDKPTVEPGKVLVEVYAASLNPFDTAVREGKTGIKLTLPVTIGGDIAGVVVDVGEGVETVSVGDEVYGQANVVAGNSGAFAEFSLTNAEQLALKPNNFSFNEAGAIPLVGVSALQAITEEINIKSGQKLLIQGGAGGIGAVALQIAKSVGAFVAVTVDTSDVQYVKNLGADVVIDYKTQQFKDVVEDYDAVFDTVGGDVFADSYEVLKSGGVAVSMIAPVDESKAATCGIVAKTQSTKVNTERLSRLRELVEAGKVTIRIDSVLPLEKVEEAFKKRESGAAKGKVVLEIKKV